MRGNKKTSANTNDNRENADNDCNDYNANNDHPVSS